MTIDPLTLLAPSRRTNTLLERFSPNTLTTYDHFFWLGQSNMRGGNGTNAAPITIPSGTAYATRADQTYYDLVDGEFTGQATGTPSNGIGACSPVYGFADQWRIDTGRTTVHTMLAWQGSPLLDATPVGTEMHWEVTDPLVATSLIRSDSLLGVNRANQVPHAENVLTYNARFKSGRRVAGWMQGTAEAPHMGTVNTVQDYVDGLDRLWTFLKATYQIELFIIFEHGRTGTDAAEVATDEPGNALVRDAQNQFVGEHSDVILVSDQGKEQGSPFNTVTIDGDGFITAGYEYNADGVHRSGVSQNADGRGAARLTAIELGYVAAPPAVV